MTLVVSGLRDVSRSFAVLERQTRVAFQHDLRHVAEPVKRDAETLALREIRNMPGSPQWARMRIGVTASSVYVVPVERGVKGRGDASRRRRKFSNLMLARAMNPALDRHEAGILRGTEAILDEVAHTFNT